MPITFVVDQERRRISTTAAGRIVLEELVDYASKRAAAGAASFDQIFDARNAIINLSAYEVDRLISASKKAHAGHPFGRTAIVAATDVTYGVARMAEVLSAAEGIESRTFRTVEEAEEWLAEPRRR